MNRIVRFLLNPLLRYIDRQILLKVPDAIPMSYTQDDLRRMGMKIGEDTSFYIDFWMHAEPYLIEVGSHTQITVGAKAFTHGGAQVARRDNPAFDTFGKVKVGDWCYIGNNVLIMPGVVIEDHCLVASGSVVTKSVPAGMVVAGNPAKIICTTEEYIERNQTINTNTKSLSYDEKKDFLLNLPESFWKEKPYLIRK